MPLVADFSLSSDDMQHWAAMVSLSNRDGKAFSRILRQARDDIHYPNPIAAYTVYSGQP